MTRTSFYRFFAAQQDALGLFDQRPINTVHGAGLHFQYPLSDVLPLLASTLFHLSKKQTGNNCIRPTNHIRH
jgi:hypothetical protein